MNNRTVATILAEFEADQAAEPIESGKVEVNNGCCLLIFFFSWMISHMSTAATDVARPHPSHRQGRDEVNLAIFPISVLTHQQPIDEHRRKVYKRTFTSKRWDAPTHQWVEQRVTLKTNSDDGLPVPFDEHLVVALLYLGWQQSSFQDTKVYFSLKQICEIMRLSVKGENYDRIERGLSRLAAVRVIYENAFWDAAANEYQATYDHGIIATYRLLRPKLNPRAKLPKDGRSWLRWNPDFFTQLQDGILTYLDLETYFSLKLPISRRMFRVLNRHLRKAQRYQSDLRIFACGHVGLSEDYDTGQLKRALGPGISELERLQVIDQAPPQSRFTKVKRGIWRIGFDQPTNPPLPPDASLPASDRLFQQLTQRGVSPATARRLTKNYPADHIQQKIEYFDFLKASKDEETPKKPGGWLTAAIEQDYQPPPHFKTAAEREAADEQQRIERERKRADQQRQHQKAARDRAELAAFMAQWRPVWDELPDAEQQRIWQTAWADNSFFTFARHRTSDIALEKCFRILAEQHGRT